MQDADNEESVNMWEERVDGNSVLSPQFCNESIGTLKERPILKEINVSSDICGKDIYSLIGDDFGVSCSLSSVKLTTGYEDI